MFEDCKSLEDLNHSRIELIKSGIPSVVVNKEYAKRKALILSKQDRGFKKLRMVKVELPELEEVLGIAGASWSDEQPYTLYVEDMHG